MNHYDTLEVSPKASAEVIRAAYKSLMQRNHPDRHADVAAATARSTRIAQAYEVLSDPQRRLAYDGALRPPAYAPVPAARRAHAGRIPPAPGRSWLVPLLLLLCIIGAGSAILVLTRKAPPAPAATQLGLRLDERLAAKPAEPLAPAPAPATRPPETAAELQARTVSGLVTNLSVDLGPVDPAKPGSAHVLTIPNLGIRLAVDDPARWTRKIQAERPRIIQQLLTNLARAQYIELIGAEGDLYLKRLIEDTVASATGLDRYTPPAVAASAGQPASTPAPKPVEALLPLSFAVR